MRAIIFPGQGSQIKGMGKTLFPNYPREVARASSILGYAIDELCRSDPNNQLGQTNFTQPALYVVNALSYFDHSRKNGVPDFLAGHSLGEYNALLAAGAFDFDTGLILVQMRGQLMAQAKGGGMLAVLQASAKDIEAILLEQKITTIDIANYNTPTQIILSGPKEAIALAEAAFSAAKVRCIALNVSAAFHSRYMQDVMLEYATFLKQFSFNPLSIPVIANATAHPYTNETIAQLLTRQIAGAVLWNDSVRYLMGQAILRNQEMQFDEMGDNPVLTRMVTEIQKTQAPLLVAEVVEQLPEKVLMESAVPPMNTTVAVPNNVITAQHLGCAQFKKDYGIRYAYVTGSMYRGIASKELVIAMGKAGLIGFLGTGGMKLVQIEADIKAIQSQLTHGQSFGMNLLCNLDRPELEMATVELYRKHGVKRVEAAAFMQITLALVLFRVTGLAVGADGKPLCQHQIIGKVSRPEVAELFMSPPPERLVERLLQEGKITTEQALLAKRLPMSHDICVEADSGGHTDQGISTVLLPAMQSLRAALMARFNYDQPVRIGLAGGLGTPQALAAAFVMGADFVLTGSINQCTVESGASEAMKNLLQNINVQDTDYAPSGDMFEIGSKVQVLRKGVFFPARANKLYSIYSHYNAIDDIPKTIRDQIEDKYFKRSFNSIWEETRQYWASQNRHELIHQVETNPKRKMAWIFRWYFRYSMMAAFEGDESKRVDYQIHTGPALGAFNQWVKGTPLESWKNRHVDQIAEKLMSETAHELHRRLTEWEKSAVL